MNDNLKNALQYIANTGGHPKIEWFDDDHEPIGPMLRADLLRAGLVVEANGHIYDKDKPPTTPQEPPP